MIEDYVWIVGVIELIPYECGRSEVHGIFLEEEDAKAAFASLLKKESRAFANRMPLNRLLREDEEVGFGLSDTPDEWT